jgi:hypothetical protein
MKKNTTQTEIGEFLPIVELDDRSNCPLCRRELPAEVLYEDEAFLVGACPDQPECALVALRQHRPEFMEDEKAWIELFVSQEFPGWVIRWEMRSLPGHAHCHIEPPGRTSG